MSGRVELLLSGSRAQGVDGWDVHTGAPLFSHANPRLAPASHRTCHSHTSTGKHQLMTVDASKPLLHTLTFSTSSTSPSSTTSTPSTSFPSPISALALSPSSLYLITASTTSPTLSLFSLPSSSLLSSFPSSHFLPITCLAFTADERFIVSGSEDGCVHVIALTDALRSSPTPPPYPLLPLLPTSSLTQSPSPSPSSDVVRLHCSFSSHTLPITALSIPPASSPSLLFSSSLDHSVHVHSLAQHSTVQRLLFPCAIATLAITHTLSDLFAGGTNGTIYHQPLIHANKHSHSSSPSSSSSPPIPLAGHSLPLTCLSLSFDCSLLASASRDGSLRVWDVRTLQCLRVLKKVGRTSFDWCGFVREAGWGQDWGGVRMGRRGGGGSGGEVEEAVTVAVKKGGSVGARGVGGGEEEKGRGERWQEMMGDWRALVGEDEVSLLRRELEGERLRRERLEAEVVQWSALSKELYGITARQALKRKAISLAVEGKEEQEGKRLPQTEKRAVEGSGEAVDEGEDEEEEEEEEEKMGGAREEAEEAADSPRVAVNVDREGADGGAADKG